MAGNNKAPLQDGQGQPLQLGKLIKSGGAGSVYHISSAKGQVAKLYHDKIDKRVYQRKTAAMLALKPQLPHITDSRVPVVQLAWPISQIFNKNKQFVGFSMPELDVKASIELEYVLQERQARAHNLPVGLGAKIQLAANLAILVDSVHQQNHFIIDMKPVNLRFYRESLYVSMLDCDGFSIQGEHERFAAGQFTVDYLAPEFQQSKLIPQSQEAQQDKFALAVILFQLLNFGIHPFSGRPLNNNVPNDLPGRIAGQYYAYGMRSHKSINPVPTSGHRYLPQDIRELFDKAFSGLPASRPSAAEWAKCLRQYAVRSQKKMVICTKNAEHQHFAGLDCAACEREKQLQIVNQEQQEKQKIRQKKEAFIPNTVHSGKVRSPQVRRVVRPKTVPTQAPPMVVYTAPAWVTATPKAVWYLLLTITIPLILAYFVSSQIDGTKPETLTLSMLYQSFIQYGASFDFELSFISLVSLLALGAVFIVGIMIPIKSILTRRP